MTLEADMLAELTPTAEERREVTKARESLESAATTALAEMGLDGVARVQGSIAKDTWISGDTDLDCFLVLPLSTPEDKLESIVSAVAKKVLTGARKKYAQHPYVIGNRDGFQVDLVPAYRIDAPDQRLSAVDRTPLHTEWVLAHLDEEAKAHVRLAKQWCKGVGVYGAETAIGGMSGYLVELLIHHHGDFQALLKWAANGCKPRRIAIDTDEVNDNVSPLVVVDPVDPTRNCAAAVTADVLALFEEASIAYLDNPRKPFFHPAPPRSEAADFLHRHIQSGKVVWLGLMLRPSTDRLDLVFPQFQRAARVAAEAMERAGFPGRQVRVDAFDEQHVGLQWIVNDVTLDERKIHVGPYVSARANAEKFRAKWDNHPDAEGGVSEDENGRLQVAVRIHHRTPAAWLQANLHLALTGKHVVKALGDEPRVLTDPAQVPPPWAPSVADVVLNRRPWQRT